MPTHNPPGISITLLVVLTGRCIPVCARAGTDVSALRMHNATAHDGCHPVCDESRVAHVTGGSANGFSLLSPRLARFSGRTGRPEYRAAAVETHPVPSVLRDRMRRCWQNRAPGSGALASRMGWATPRISKCHHILSVSERNKVALCDRDCQNGTIWCSTRSPVPHMYTHRVPQ